MISISNNSNTNVSNKVICKQNAFALFVWTFCWPFYIVLFFLKKIKNYIINAQNSIRSWLYT